MVDAKIAQFERRLARERSARKQAEQLLDHKSLELYNSNQELAGVVAALEQSSSRLSTILDHSYAATVVTDAQDIVCLVNRAGHSMFRGHEAEIENHSIMELFIPEFRYLCKQAAASIIGIGGEGASEIWHQAHGLRSDGSDFPIEFIVTDLRSSERGNRVWIFRDLTQKVTAELQRLALEDELRQAQKLEALGAMAGGVAHEINTPIQYVGDNIGFVRDGIDELLSVFAAYRHVAELADAEADISDALHAARKSEVDADLAFVIAEVPEAITQAIEGLERVSKIVQAVKQFAHPGGDHPTVFDVNDSIKSTIEVARSQWKYVAEMETSLASNLPELTGHQGEFNQVILNLIVNAAQAIEESSTSKPGIIRINTALLDGAVSIEISDNGVGIPSEVQSRIFDPFFTTKDVGKGTGQGLALSYRIITQGFNGMIEVNSEPVAGASFILKLPVCTEVLI